MAKAMEINKTVKQVCSNCLDSTNDEFSTHKCVLSNVYLSPATCMCIYNAAGESEDNTICDVKDTSHSGR